MNDEGNIIAIEGIIVATLMLGAIYATTSAYDTPVSAAQTRPLRVDLEDSLTILDGLSNGSRLSTYLGQALDCTYGQNPSTTGCDGTRPANLSERMDRYLPVGSRYTLAIDNGLEAKPLYASGTPAGERVSASRAFTPDWNLTYITTDFSCYESGMTLNATLIPIWHAEIATPTTINVTAESTNRSANTTADSALWNVTLPPSYAGKDLSAQTNTTRGLIEGATTTTSCDLGGHGWSLRNALNESTLSVTGPSGSRVIPVGQSATIAYDFSAIATRVPGAVLSSVGLRTYEPAPSRFPVPDTFVELTTGALGTSWTDSVAFSVPSDSLYGVHPTTLVATVDVPTATGTTSVELRLTTTIEVALQSGVVPFNPSYRAILEGWLLDWR